MHSYIDSFSSERPIVAEDIYHERGTIFIYIYMCILKWSVFKVNCACSGHKSRPLTLDIGHHCPV